jgi:dolichyl-phosphate beta-glucosyltransferase
MPHLSVIIPAYNESERLPDTLALVRDYLEKKDFSYEVLVVDDGSKDNTVAVAEEFQSRFPALKIIKNAENKGKGGVVRQGLLAATGEYRLFMDADHSTPITEVEKFLPYFGKADVIIGSRYLHPESIKVKQPWKRRVVSRIGNWLIRHTILPGIIDTQCGFKAYSAAAAEAVFQRQTMEGWSFDFEALAIARQLGFTIQEVAVDWYDAKQSKLRAVHAAIDTYRDLLTIRKRVKRNMYV